MRSLSRSLVKQIYTVVQSDEKRIIDTNALVQRRLNALYEKQGGGDGFVSGLDAENVEVAAGRDGADGAESNVIKAKEDAGRLVEEARANSQQILENARQEADRIREEARAEAEREKADILENARKQGYTEGNNRAQAEGEAARQEYLKKEKLLEDQYQQKLEELEPQMVDTITQVYEHIFHVDLQSNRDILTYLISNTLRKIDGERDFIIHVSKEDYPYVNMQKKQMLAGAVSANSNVEIIEDMTLAKNECMIETDSGIYDCGLGTQLEELRKKLMLLAWQKE